jgi:hypothetical protein
MTYFPSYNRLTIAGCEFNLSDPNTIVLYGRTTAGSGNCSFRLWNGSSGYQVPVGKTLTIRAVVQTRGSTGEFVLLQSDNDLGLASGTALTNPVYPGGDSSIGTIDTAFAKSGLVNVIIAAQKYCSMSQAISASIMLVGTIA